jgi:hypothetical protein
VGQPIRRGSPYPSGPPPALPRPRSPHPSERVPRAPAPVPQRPPSARGWRLLIVAGCVLIALSVVLMDVARGWPGSGSLRRLAGRPAGGAAGAPAAPATGTAAGSGSAPAPSAAAGSGSPATAGSPAPSVAVPQTGAGTFGFAPGPGPVLGTAGDVRRFRVAVENGIGQDPAAFAAAAERILGDQRSWITGGDVRFQRVAQASQFEFTLYLASPVTTDKLCSLGGVHTEGFASCRLPGQVVINLARWLASVPDYGAPLSVYQEYAINHEVGRELGHGNELCPAPGALAPVMQQQSQGLKGCVANAWPYVNGQLYAGKALP